MWALPLGCSPLPPPAGAEPSKNVWRPRAPTWALLGAQPHSPLVRPRESLLKVSASPRGGEGGGGPAARHGSRHAIWTPRAGCAPNQTSNQTSARSLVSWPRLPRFGSFPFRFPFRGEKGSASHGWGKGASAHFRMSPRVLLEIHLVELGGWRFRGQEEARRNCV